MLVPPWDQSALGTTVDLVLQSVLQDCEGHAIMRILGTQQHVEVQDVQLDQQAVFTFLNLQVMAVTPRPVLQVTKETRQFVHPPTSYASVCKCIELCAGAGFMSQGATACGFHPIIGVEKNSRFASLYSLQHDGKFICKDIGSTAAIAEALSSGASGVTLLSGFSCQPYSCAGDRRGFRDSRADALPSSLRFAWLVQAPVVILECTPLAKDDPNVQAALANFLQLSGFQINQVILRLSNCWAARRDRWWCVMMPKVLGSLSIPDLPIMPEYQVVGGIMPYIRHWPEKDIAELILSLHEHLKFRAYAGPLESLALDFKKPLPTALHAWGNQIYPCGCGCRSGLSEERLKTKGLHGVLIPGKNMLHHEGDSFPECRHVHPAEVLLLCGGRPDLSFDSMRLGLAAVGQLASPIQSLWILSHVRQAIASFAGESSPDPHQLLCEYQNSLLAIRDKMWPVIPTPSLVPTRTEQHLVDSVVQQWVNLRWEGCLFGWCILPCPVFTRSNPWEFVWSRGQFSRYPKGWCSSPHNSRDSVWNKQTVDFRRNHRAFASCFSTRSSGPRGFHRPPKRYPRRQFWASNRSAHATPSWTNWTTWESHKGSSMLCAKRGTHEIADSFSCHSWILARVAKSDDWFEFQEKGFGDPRGFMGWWSNLLSLDKCRPASNFGASSPCVGSVSCHWPFQIST